VYMAEWYEVEKWTSGGDARINRSLQGSRWDDTQPPSSSLNSSSVCAFYGLVIKNSCFESSIIGLVVRYWPGAFARTF
jgi:hypothetical protein